MSGAIINASTSLVQAVPPDIVYLSTLNYPGQIITVRDFSGVCSTGNTIRISTTSGVSFLNGLSNFYEISQPFGFLTFTSKTSSIWAVVNAFAFQNQTFADIDSLNADFINTSSVYAHMLSTSFLFPSTIGVNCNAPRFPVDIHGILNFQQLYQDGRPFVPDGNLSTVNSSTINILTNVNLSNSTPLDPPYLRVQDTVIYGGAPTIPLGSNQIFLQSNIMNFNSTLYLTSNRFAGFGTSNTNQQVDVVGNVQADALLLRSSMITIPAAIQPASLSSIEMVATANNLWFFSEDTSDNSNRVFVSFTNGFTWSTSSTYAGFSRNALIHASGIYVAGGVRTDSTGNAIVFGSNGFSWTAAAANTFTAVNSLAFNASIGRFAAVGVAQGLGQAFATSTDGSNWTFAGPTGRTYNECISFSNGFLVVGQNNVLDFFVNTGGASFTVTSFGSSLPVNMTGPKTLQQVGSLIYIGGTTNGTSNGTLISGPSTLSGPWTSQTNPLITVHKLKFFSSIFVATGDTGVSPQTNSAIITSLNGSTWTPRSNALVGSGKDIAYLNGQWIIGGNTSIANYSTGALIASLDNGTTWNQTVLANFVSSSKITTSSSYIFLNDINLTEQFTSNASFYSTINSLQDGNRSTVAGLGSTGYLSTVLSTFSNLFTSTIQSTNPASTIRLLANISVANTNITLPDIQLPGLAIRQGYSATNPTNYMQTASDRLNINNTLLITNTGSGTTGRVGVGGDPTSNFLLDVRGTANIASQLNATYIAVNTTTSNPSYVVNANGTINATSYLRNGVDPIFPNPLSSVVMSTVLINSTNGFALTNNASTVLGGLLSSVGGANFGGAVNAASYLRGDVPIPRAYSTFQLSSLSLSNSSSNALVVVGSTIINGLISTNGSIQTGGIINAGGFLLNGNPFAPDSVSSIIVSSLRSMVDPLVPIAINSFVNATNQSIPSVWFAGVSNAGGTIGRFSTDNGSTWQTASGLIGTDLTNITAVGWNGRYFLAAGVQTNQTTNSVFLFSSINGSVWTSISASGVYPRTRVNKIIWANNQWVIGGSFTESSTNASNATIARSVDGGTWAGCVSGGFSDSLLVAGECFDLAYNPNGNLLIAMGRNANPNVQTIKYSTDNASNWTSIAGSPFMVGRAVTTNGRILVSGGESGIILYSFNGITWSNAVGVPQNYNNTTLSVTTNGRVFVAHNRESGGPFRFLHSFDGINWNTGTTTSTVAGFATSITWNGSQFIAGSTSNYIMHTSVDGVTWNSVIPSGTPGTNIITLAFTSNVNPDFQVENLSIYGRNQPPLTRSTNVIQMSSNDLIIDRVLRVGTDNRVGINCNAPQYTLDVNGTLFASTIVAANISGFVSDTNLRSTVAGLGSSGYVSTSYVTSSLTGLGTLGYISTSGLVTALTSSVAGLGSSGYVSTSYVTSSLTGLGSLGYISTASLTSTVQSLTTTQNTAEITTSTLLSRVSPTTPLEVNAFLDVMNQRTSNIWVAAGVSGNGCLRYSFNGSNWSNTNITAANAQDVAWNGNYFLSATNNGFDGGSIQYVSSVNGASWGSIPVTGSIPLGQVNAILWTGSQWVVGGSLANTLTYSPNGVAWTSASSGSFASRCSGLATNGRLLVAVGQDSTTAGNIKYSIDNGVTWSNGTGATFSGGGLAVSTDGRNWIAVGIDTNSNAIMKYSANGINWSNISTTGANGLSGAAVGVKYNGRLWVVTGNNNDANQNTYLYSFNGLNWSYGTATSANTTSASPTWSGSLWVAPTNDVSAGNRLRWSLDGINWNASVNANIFGNQANAVAFTSNVFPDLQVENLSIYGKSQFPTQNSTNSIYLGVSSMNINNLLYVQQNPHRIGINCNAPTQTLDILGTSRIQHFNTFTNTITPTLQLINAGSISNSISFFTNLSPGNYGGLATTGDMGMIFTAGSINTGNLILSPWGEGARGIKIMSTGNVGVNMTPSSIALDVNGAVHTNSNFYVTGGNGAPFVTTLAGSSVAGSANGTGTAASFNRGIGICVDTNGIVYLADNVNNSIRKITPGGVVTTLNGTFEGIGGMTISADNNTLYFVCVRTPVNVSAVYSYNIASQTGTLIAGSMSALGYVDNATGTTARFNNPFAIALDTTNNCLYVGDRSNYRIRRIALTASYAVTTIAGSGVNGFADNSTGTSATFSQMGGLRVNQNGTFLYVADSENNLIRRISLTSPFAVTTIAGTVGANQMFNNPQDIVFNTGFTRLYIVNQGYNVIYFLVISDNSVGTFAGRTGYANPPNTAAQNGLLANSLFLGPRGIACDTNNIIYVSEDAGYRIRKITNNSSGSTRPLHTFEYINGGFNHYITSRHTPVEGLADTNAIDFYLNTSSNSSGSSGIGISTILGASITAAGLLVNGYSVNSYLNSNGITSRILNSFNNLTAYPVTSRTKVGEVVIDTGNYNGSMTLLQNSYADDLDLSFFTPTGGNNQTPVERITIKSGATRVGINTTSPDNTLTVKGVFQVTDIINDQKFAMYSFGSRFFLNPRNSSGGFNNINGIVMSNNGNVGINTISPITTLDVIGNQRIVAQGSTSLTAYGLQVGNTETLMLMSPCNAYQGGAASLFFGLNGTANFPLARIVARDIATGSGAYQSELLFQTNDVGTSLATRMIINRDGFVGIGCNSPSYRLDIGGVIKTQNTANNVTHQIHFGIAGSGISPKNAPFTSISDGPVNNNPFDGNAYGMLQLIRPANQNDSRGHLAFIRAGNYAVIQGFQNNTSVWGLQAWDTTTTAGMFFDTTNERFGFFNKTPATRLVVDVPDTTGLTGFAARSSDVNVVIGAYSANNWGSIQVTNNGTASAIGTTPYGLSLQPRGGVTYASGDFGFGGMSASLLYYITLGVITDGKSNGVEVTMVHLIWTGETGGARDLDSTQMNKANRLYLAPRVKVKLFQFPANNTGAGTSWTYENTSYTAGTWINLLSSGGGDDVDSYIAWLI